MRVLGIHDGHTATATLLEDGKILACISEDRLNRRKEWSGFPSKAIKEVLHIGKTRSDEIDKVVFTSILPPLTRKQIDGQVKTKQVVIFGIMNAVLPVSSMRGNWWVKTALSKFKRDPTAIYKHLEKLGISKNKVEFVNHHTCHAYSSLLNWWGQSDDMLILTLDGSGDALCGTVRVIPEGHTGEMEVVEEINSYNSLGIFYSRVTEYLGMKPLSHEYKVMGMAGYGHEKYYLPVYEKMRENYFKVNGLQFENLSGCWGKDYLPQLTKDFQGVRFDNLCAGAQRVVEELLVEWVTNAVKKTGIGNVFCSGGVFLNVKANQRILHEVGDIGRFFVFPSSGDDSTSIGAAIYAYHQWCREHDEKFKVSKLGPIYWGPKYSDTEVEDAIRKSGHAYEEVKDIDAFVGESLAEGRVIARRSGRLEWGARALGNCSILSDARNLDTVRRINNMIKFRDFWMPFAPSILDTWADKYIINPKNVMAPYMILSFDTKEESHRDLIAALHPHDLTCRPQVVTKGCNPHYYEILKTFEEGTGVGGFLNTSFNLHGDPMVCSPKDALYTFDSSGLDLLVMNNFVVRR